VLMDVFIERRISPLRFCVPSGESPHVRSSWLPLQTPVLLERIRILEYIKIPSNAKAHMINR
jgi:hypothetical protein